MSTSPRSHAQDNLGLPALIPDATGCKVCDKALGRGNRTGHCGRHVSAFNAQDPAWRAKQKGGIRRKYQADPLFLEQKRRDMRKANEARDIEALRLRMVEGRYWEKSNEGRPPGHPSRKRAGVTMSNTKLADIPPHLRNEYRELSQRKHFSAAEARAIILAQHERDMERFRAKFAPPPPEPLPQDRRELIGRKVLPPVPAPTELIAAIATDFGFTLAQVLSEVRKRPLARCRQTVYAILVARGNSRNQAAKWMGRDHSTVIFGVDNFPANAAHDPHMMRVFRAYTTDNDNAAADESEAA
jgi:hypothetical protein